MPSTVKYFPLDDSKPEVTAYSSADFGAFRELVEALATDEDDADKFDTLELWHGDDDYVEAVTYDGEVIGTLDNRPLYPISEYETFDQMEAREAAEEAARDLNYEARLDARRAAE